LIPAIASAHAEMAKYKTKIVANKRHRDEEMSKVIEAQEIDQKRVQDEHRTVRQGREETLRHFKDNQISREAELRKRNGVDQGGCQGWKRHQYSGSLSSRRNWYIWGSRDW
jgi:hypothetical protein